MKKKEMLELLPIIADTTSGMPFEKTFILRRGEEEEIYDVCADTEQEFTEAENTLKKRGWNVTYGSPDDGEDEPVFVSVGDLLEIVS